VAGLSRDDFTGWPGNCFFADNMMVGHVGTIELAAAAFANNIINVVMYFGLGLTYGLTPLVGQVHTNRVKTTELLKNGFATYLISSLILFMVLTGLYFFLTRFGQTGEVVTQAKPYYLWVCASFVPFMVFYTFKQFLEGMGNTKIAMTITIIANIINIVINYIFIFGKFGFPRLGLVGEELEPLLPVFQCQLYLS
jgi:MATE family multidrug resistance protein